MVGQTTLSKFLILHLQKNQTEPDLAALMIDVAAAVKKISSMTSKGALGVYRDGDAATTTLEALSREAIVSACEFGGQLAGILCDQLQASDTTGGSEPGKYLLVFDALDGASNTDVNVSVGSIFSVLKYTGKGQPLDASYLQPGREQVAAGYAIYGPATMLVISVGDGTHGFTLDREVGNFILTHPDMQIPHETSEFAIDSSRERFWEPPMQRYMKECKDGSSGIRQRNFKMRWVASRVADVHRILMRGGIFMYPRDLESPAVPGRLRLLHEVNPLAMVVTEAGGLASTGRERIEKVEVADIDQRTPVVLGSAAEVERIERYHAEYDAGTDEEYVSPLFRERSLFRD